MRGTAYGVGVGPGDPELITLKAVRLIRENEVIAVPGKEAENSVAYIIAAAAVPEIAEKTLVPIYMPMVRDRAKIEEEHRKGAKLLEKYLDQGKNVVYLTLGDSTIYCTFSYLQHILEEDGYRVELVSGIPSFCAAAARLNISLTEWNEPLHVIPASHKKGEALDLAGTVRPQQAEKLSVFDRQVNMIHCRESPEFLCESLYLNHLFPCLPVNHT